MLVLWVMVWCIPGGCSGEIIILVIIFVHKM